MRLDRQQAGDVEQLGQQGDARPVVAHERLAEQLGAGQREQLGQGHARAVFEYDRRRVRGGLVIVGLGGELERLAVAAGTRVEALEREEAAPTPRPLDEVVGVDDERALGQRGGEARRAAAQALGDRHRGASSSERR